MKAPNVLGTALALTAVGAVTIPAAIAVAGTRTASTAQTVHATARVTHGHQTDTGRKGPSAGDGLTFGGTITGGLAGTFDATCTSSTARRQICAITFRLAGGTITAQADYGTRGATALTPITGGSGQYAAVQGDVHEQEKQGGRIDELTFHLTG